MCRVEVTSSSKQFTPKHNVCEPCVNFTARLITWHPRSSHKIKVWNLNVHTNSYVTNIFISLKTCSHRATTLRIPLRWRARWIRNLFCHSARKKIKCVVHQRYLSRSVWTGLKNVSSCRKFINILFPNMEFNFSIFLLGEFVTEKNSNMNCWLWDGVSASFSFNSLKPGIQDCRINK